MELNRKDPNDQWLIDRAGVLMESEFSDRLGGVIIEDLSASCTQRRVHCRRRP